MAEVENFFDHLHPIRRRLDRIDHDIGAIKGPPDRLAADLAQIHVTLAGQSLHLDSRVTLI